MRIFRLLIASGLGIALLAGCVANQTSYGTFTFLPLQPSDLNSARPDIGPCGGTHGVQARPCPVRLTHATRDTGVVVTVDGPGVGWAASDDNACYYVCHAQRLNSLYTQFLITSGSRCATGYVEFFAYRSPSGGRVGQSKVKVINKYCPGSKR